MQRAKKNNGHNNNPSGFQIINETESIIHGAGDYGGVKRSSEDACLDNCTDSDNDALSPHTSMGNFSPSVDIHGNAKAGKKTRGRVKIDMKYIDNKLRRYTTFSKRKTGIMKKAYELSTLTGTQVMLLVASETGHVYTFATRKLQPMITSETGKALIQTCLNSPDLGQSSPGQVLSGDQRMNPNGFEETEITYSQDDDNSQRDAATGVLNIKQENTFIPKPVAPTPSFVIQSGGQTNGEVLPNPVSLPIKNQNAASMAQYTTVQPAAKSNNMAAVQLPPPGFMLQTGGNNLPPISVSPFVDGAVSISQNNTMVQQSQTTIPQYSAPAAAPVNTSQHIENQSINTAASLPTTTVQQQQGLIMSGGTIGSTSQPAFVYQTPGMVYAAPQQVPEGLLLQTSALGMPLTNDQQQPAGTNAPQYITIPVPVSLANAAAQPQMFSIPVAQTSNEGAQLPVDIKKS